MMPSSASALLNELPPMGLTFVPPSSPSAGQIGEALMKPWSGAFLWICIWAVHVIMMSLAFRKVQLSDRLHALGFSHSLVILPAYVFFVWMREPLTMNAPPTLNHYLIMNITAGYMIVDSIGFAIHCVRARRSMMIYFMHHLGALLGLGGAYVSGTFASETTLTLFLLLLHAPLYYIGRYVRSLGMVERSDMLKQLSSDIDALVAFIYGPPILVYVARSDCHVFFKLCGLFLAVSNYLWVFIIQYKRFTKGKKAGVFLVAGCKAGMEVTAVGDMVNGKVVPAAEVARAPEQ